MDENRDSARIRTTVKFDANKYSSELLRINDIENKTLEVERRREGDLMGGRVSLKDEHFYQQQCILLFPYCNNDHFYNMGTNKT